MSDRKIDAMHRLFGVIPEKRCEDCSNLIKGRYHNMFLRKCTVYGATHSEASDWRKKYVACGLFNKEYHGNPIIACLPRSNPVIGEPLKPIEGQISLLEEEINESST